MDITEIRQKAEELKADTIHVKYAADGKTVKKAALFRDDKKVFAFPPSYSPRLFPKGMTNDSRLFKIDRQGSPYQESWRNV